jgi:signal transduction histidine kinase
MKDKSLLDEFVGSTRRLLVLLGALFFAALVIIDSFFVFHDTKNEIKKRMNDFADQQTVYLQLYDYRSIANHLEHFRQHNNLKFLALNDPYGKWLGDQNYSENDRIQSSWADIAVDAQIEQFGKVTLVSRIDTGKIFRMTILRSVIIFSFVITFLSVLIVLTRRILSRLIGQLKSVSEKVQNAESVQDLENVLVDGTYFKEIQVFVEKIKFSAHKLDELYQSQSKLSRAAAVAQMSQTLAHDLKNPLSLFEFAMSARSLNEFEDAKLSMARAFERIHSILSNLAHKSADLVINRGASTLDCNHVAAQFRLTHGHLGIEVASIGTSIIEANFDKNSIERCLANLVGNAIEAGANRVNLVTLNSGRDLTIEVRDNGPGVSQELLPKLFARGATFGKEHGEGIGLYNVKSIIEAHGGDVSYSRVGSESIFRLALPDILVLEQGPEPLPPETTESEATHTTLTPEPELGTTRPQILIYLNDTNRSSELASTLQTLEIDICLDPEISQDPVLVYTDNIAVTSQFVTKGVKLCLDSSSTPIASASRQIQLMLKSITNLPLKGFQ